jgi:hypothetical protein
VIIGLDFDGTYSLDPPFWDSFIALAKACGHKVVCVTCREETLESVQECDVPGVLTYFTNRAPKDWYMREKGVEVDVWIDDFPESVTKGR